MNDLELAAFAEQVAVTARRVLGLGASPAVLDQYAREAVLDLWMTGPQITVAVADLALCLVREILTEEPGRAVQQVAA